MVVDAATGEPIALTKVAASFSVVTIVARGPGVWSPGPDSRVELRLRGMRDTTLVLALEDPAPVIVAHKFDVAVRGDGHAGLPPGNYTVQVRLVMKGSRSLAESVPIHLVVADQSHL